MGGFNKQNRYGATAYSHQHQNQKMGGQGFSRQHHHHHHDQQYALNDTNQHYYQQQEPMGYSSLPEYRMPEEKKKNHSCGLPKPRSHIVPADPSFSSRSSSQQQPVVVDSPTMSTSSSSSGKDTASSSSCNNVSINAAATCGAHYHNDPYNISCARVSCYQQVQHIGHDDGYFPDMQQEPEQKTCDATHNHHHHWEEQQYPNMSQTQVDGYVDQQQEHTQQASAVEEHYGGRFDNVAPMKTQLPPGTLHGTLESYVSFMPYPTEEFYNPTKEDFKAAGLRPEDVKMNMSRVFLGQLPYQVTEMQLDWLCYTFGNGGAVYFTERIIKHDPLRGCRVPTGCIHAYADNNCVTDMLNAMHKRLLIDDTGVWFAANPEEQRALSDYCTMMKNDRTKRYQNRPYDTVVAQFATSNYVRPRSRQM